MFFLYKNMDFLWAGRHGPKLIPGTINEFKWQSGDIRRATRAEFLTALGIAEPALNVLTQQLYKALGYISFFTTGEDEVRAWTIRQGSTAVEAAYTIHSDIARGFIRAEVMKYDELIAAGMTGHAAEVKLKETGRLLVKGKDYLVEDGDTVHIRHSG